VYKPASDSENLLKLLVSEIELFVKLLLKTKIKETNTTATTINKIVVINGD
jgi:hypothetical protein